MGTIVSTFVALCILLARFVIADPPIYDVVKFGAVGDGRHDDTQAFLKAWCAACSIVGAVTFSVPPEKTFLLNTISFMGPCSSTIHVQIMGSIIGPEWDVKSGGKTQWQWITFQNVDNLTIDGQGQIDGRGSEWWDCKNKGQCSYTPDAFGLMHCNNARLAGLSFINGPAKHVNVYGSVGVGVDGLTITSPEDSPNTDGIHIQEAQQVQVTDCVIRTGDDCIGLGTGSSNINISRMTCGPGHGISIGSLGRDGSKDTVEKVYVSDCKLTNTTNGVRIKTWQGGQGSVSQVSFQHIQLTSVRYPIIIDQYYCPHDDCQNKTGAVQVSDVRYMDIHGTTPDEVAINLACSETHACRGIVVENVDIRPAPNSGRGGQAGVKSYCLNARGSCNDPVFPEVPCLE